MNDPVEKISGMLRRIQEQGGQGNFVVFIADADKNYYVQIMASMEDKRLLAEAVSNEFLEREHKLNPSQIEKMVTLGWIKPGPTPNFHREWKASNDQDRLEISREVRDTFLEVYGWKPGDGIEVELAPE